MIQKSLFNRLIFSGFSNKSQKTIKQSSIVGVNAGRRAQGARDEVAHGLEF
jgi:hypothetical protein